MGDYEWKEDDTTPITAAQLNRLESEIGNPGYVVPPVDVTPGTGGSWEDVDVSGTVDTGANFAVLTCVVGSTKSLRLRPNGETDEMYYFSHEAEPIVVIMPLDSGIFEAYLSTSAPGPTIELVCWF